MNQVGYPCFVKPVMSSSGKGQSLMSDRRVEIDRGLGLCASRPDGWSRARVIVEGGIRLRVTRTSHC